MCLVGHAQAFFGNLEHDRALEERSERCLHRAHASDDEAERVELFGADGVHQRGGGFGRGATRDVRLLLRAFATLETRGLELVDFLFAALRRGGRGRRCRRGQRQRQRAVRLATRKRRVPRLRNGRGSAHWRLRCRTCDRTRCFGSARARAARVGRDVGRGEGRADGANLGSDRRLRSAPCSRASSATATAARTGGRGRRA